MCTGMELFLISAALSGGGAMYNNNLQNKAISEQNSQNQQVMAMQEAARAQEAARQLEMEEQQFADVATAATASDPAALAQRIVDETEGPDNAFVNMDDYNAGEIQGQFSTGETADTIGKTVGDAVARTKEMLKAQSVLSAQGTGFGGMQDAALRMRDNVANVGSNRRRSTGVAQMETSLPTPIVTKSDSPLGDIMMLAGQALGGYAGGGGTFGGVTGAASSTQPLNAIPWLGQMNPAQAASPFKVGFM